LDNLVTKNYLSNVLDELIEDKAEIFSIPINTLAHNLENDSEKKDFFQVYDGLFQKWFSVDNHIQETESYFKQISDKDTSSHYLKNFYSNLIDEKSIQLDSYVNFFITPQVSPFTEIDFCNYCLDAKYVSCEECFADRSGSSITFCDACEDSGVVECPECSDDVAYEYLVGAVMWYNFNTPYTNETNNAAYIDSIAYLGTYEFYKKEKADIRLDQNQVSDDVTSAYIWSKLSDLKAVKTFSDDKKINTAYYGLINNYTDLINRITQRINTEM